MKTPFNEKFFGNSELLHKELRTKPARYWEKRGEEHALRLFHDMASDVPAYQDFLKERKVDPNQIQTIDDFKTLPLTNKENYLQKYSMTDLAWGSDAKKSKWVISSTSGSTGEPFYFPRTIAQDTQFALTAEIMLKEYFKIDQRKTLFLDCFALGVWIGGIFMYQAIKTIMENSNYQLSILTPGSDKVEAIKALQNLAGNFDQVVIGGYAPLVKDLIADGIDAGLDWKKIAPKFFFAAEGFTEEFRDYLQKHGGLQDIYTDAINHYGTADLGTMAHETASSISIRRLARSQRVVHEKLFGISDRVPTLTQYLPELYYFEELDGQLICSSLGGYPLCRYDLKDTGRVFSYDEMNKQLRDCSVELTNELTKNHLNQTAWKLPFIQTGQRADLTVSIYSVNIYPDSIKKVAEDEKYEGKLSGKFQMIVDYNEAADQILEINFELRPKVQASEDLRKDLLEAVVLVLKKENSEWRDFYDDAKIRPKILPKVELRSYQDERYFLTSVKQTWARK